MQTTHPSNKGEFKASPPTFTNWITADGKYKPAKGRYHLYVSLACPFAHRAIVMRQLKGLQDVIGMTVVDYILRYDKGWAFNDEREGCEADPVYGYQYLRQIYEKSCPEYDGRITVPVLFDKETETIVNNESADLIIILNSAFNEFCPTEEQKNLNLSPDNKKELIEELNSWITPELNRGVYVCGFAQTQETYDKGIKLVFDALDKLEKILSTSRFLTGPTLTLADIPLFTSLIRFDKVYVGHFKVNKKMLKDYPALWGYVRDIYQMPCIKECVNFDHITKHYYLSHVMIEPYSIVPIGPDLDFMSPHHRESLSA